tara:strand:+ start:1980 stop:2234 length:255 start_codon:yes stop_codon:yes gene_type:complete
MDWTTLLIPLITKLFEKCQNESNAKRAKAIKRRPAIARSRLRRALREDGISGKKLRRTLNGMMSDLQAAEVDDVEELLDDLENK